MKASNKIKAIWSNKELIIKSIGIYLLDLVVYYGTFKKIKLAGRKRYEERIKICRQCDSFRYGYPDCVNPLDTCCGICGCSSKLKLRLEQKQVGDICPLWKF